MTAWRQLRLAVRISRRFARSSRLRASALTALLASAAVIGMYVVLTAQGLSGEQRADRDLGRFGAALGSGVASIPPGDGGREEVERRVRGIDPDAQVKLIATDLSVSALTSGSVTMTEMDWTSEPFPRAWELEAGRWPSAAGEVAIINPPGAASGYLGDRIATYGGTVVFEVVGLVDDRFSTSAGLASAPGTWAGLDEDLARTSPILRATPIVYWDGTRPSEVAAAVAQSYRSVLGKDAPGTSELEDTLIDRASVTARDSESWIAKSPAGYSIPSLLLPAMAGILMFAFNLRAFGGSLARLTAVGMSRRTGLAGVSIAVAGWCAAAAAGGAAAGAVIGHVAARVIAARSGTPVPQIPDLTSPTVRLLLMSMVGCAVGATLLQQTARDREHGRQRARRSSTRLRDARHLLAVAVVAATAVALTRLDSPQKAMMLALLIATAVLLVLPDLLPALVRRLPEAGVRPRLAKRQLMADHRRVTAVVGMLAVLIGVSTGFVALLDTMIRTAGAQTYPDALPGQVVVAERGTGVLAPPDGARAVVREAIGPQVGPPVSIRLLDDPDPAAEGWTHVRAGTLDGLVLAVDSDVDVERLTGSRLAPDQHEVLDAGGLLVGSSQVDESATDLRIGESDAVVATVPSRALELEKAGWTIGVAGLMLTSTARDLGMPVQDGAVVFTGVSESSARAARSALEDAGMDPKSVAIYQAPPPPIPPTALYLTAIGLAVIVLGMTLGLTRAQVRTMRDYLGAVVAMGLPPRWARQVVVLQQLSMLAAATVLGLVIGMPAALAAAVLIPGFDLSVPWAQLTVLLLSLYGATLVAATLSSARVTARERR